MNSFYMKQVIIILYSLCVAVKFACADTDHTIKKYYLTIENHVFSPSVITIPANTKVKLIIENKDDVAEEFDSFDLNREKVIFAHRKAVIFVGPLPEGEYSYFGEFHPNSARGIIIVKGSSDAY